MQISWWAGEKQTKKRKTATNHGFERWISSGVKLKFDQKFSTYVTTQFWKKFVCKFSSKTDSSKFNSRHTPKTLCKYCSFCSSSALSHLNALIRKLQITFSIDTNQAPVDSCVQHNSRRGTWPSPQLGALSCWLGWSTFYRACLAHLLPGQRSQKRRKINAKISVDESLRLKSTLEYWG